MKKLLYIVFVLAFAIIQASAQTMNITYKTSTDKNADLNLTISATYPQVDFGPEALMGVRGIAQDINNSLDTMVNQMIQGFINEVSQMPNKTVNGMGSSLEITSKASVISGTFLTAQIIQNSSIAGAAHPLTTIQSFNYSIISGGLLNISNLFVSGSDYLNYISNYSMTQLKAYAQKEGYSIEDMINQGASPDLKNFNTWNITNDSLIITFNPYQVAPYVFGIQTVSIPLSDMTSMIDPKGPLSFMFR